MIGPFRGVYWFLSNFALSEFVTPKGTRVSSVEHAFQACKTTCPKQQAWVLAAPSPGEAKKRGRRVTLRTDWESRKVGYMLGLLRLKFGNPELRRKLLSTAPEELVEVNTWGDVFWGVSEGKGENMLGKLLMQVRSEIARQEGGLYQFNSARLSSKEIEDTPVVQCKACDEEIPARLARRSSYGVFCRPCFMNNYTQATQREIDELIREDYPE